METQEVAVRLLKLSRVESITPATQTTGPRFGQLRVASLLAWNAYESNRELIREPAAEMLGTMILTLFGTAGNCQVVLSANTGVAASPKGDFLAQAFGWGCGLSIWFFHRTSDHERRQVLVWVYGSLEVLPKAT